MVQFLVPVRATVQESAQLIRLCEQAERHEGPLALDCRETTMFGPFGVAMLASSIAIRRRSGHATTLVPPADQVAADFVEEIGLSRFANGTATGLGTLEVRQLLALDASYTEAVTGMLLRGVPGMTEDTSYPVQLCLNELLQNVFEWSHSPVGCIVLARWYLRTRSVRFAVVDRGVGIPAALRRGMTQNLHRATDADVIEAAVTMPQLTSRENRVGGLGLKTIREVVVERKGRLTIVSHGAKVVWNGAKVSRFASQPLRGTAIEIDFRPTEPISHPRNYDPVF